MQKNQQTPTIVINKYVSNKKKKRSRESEVEDTCR